MYVYTGVRQWTGIQGIYTDFTRQIFGLELTSASFEFNQSIHRSPRYKLSQENLSRETRNEWYVVGCSKSVAISGSRICGR